MEFDKIAEQWEWGKWSDLKPNDTFRAGTRGNQWHLQRGRTHDTNAASWTALLALDGIGFNLPFQYVWSWTVVFSTCLTWSKLLTRLPDVWRRSQCPVKIAYSFLSNFFIFKWMSHLIRFSTLFKAAVKFQWAAFSQEGPFFHQTRAPCMCLLLPYRACGIGLPISPPEFSCASWLLLWLVL